MTGRKVFIVSAAVLAAATFTTVASISGAKSVIGFFIAWILVTSLFFAGLVVGLKGEWDFPNVKASSRQFP